MGYNAKGHNETVKLTVISAWGVMTSPPPTHPPSANRIKGVTQNLNITVKTRR